MTFVSYSDLSLNDAGQRHRHSLEAEIVTLSCLIAAFSDEIFLPIVVFADVVAVVVDPTRRFDGDDAVFGYYCCHSR